MEPDVLQTFAETNAAVKLNTVVANAANSQGLITRSEKVKIETLMQEMLTKAKAIQENEGAHSKPTLDLMGRVLKTMKDNNITESDALLGNEIQQLNVIFKPLLAKKGITI